MYHAHFNTGQTTMRHFAMRGSSPKYSQDRYRTKLHDMLPFNEEPPDIHPEYLRDLAKNGVPGKVLSAYAEDRGREPGDECVGRTLRSSKSEGG